MKKTLITVVDLQYYRFKGGGAEVPRPITLKYQKPIRTALFLVLETAVIHQHKYYTLYNYIHHNDREDLTSPTKTNMYNRPTVISESKCGAL